jgi:hypothetical protein
MQNLKFFGFHKKWEYISIRSEIISRPGMNFLFENNVNACDNLFFVNLFVSSVLYLNFIAIINIISTKNGVFMDIAPCGSCKNRRFGGA